MTTISRTLGPDAESSAGNNLRDKTVLCADDDEDQLTARRMLLESAGVKVLTAKSGQEALELFEKAGAVDAVVLDYYMPGMKGLSVAREIKRLRSNVPIVVLSGFAALPDETIGVIDRWLQKRDVTELLGELEQLMQQKTVGRPGT